MHNLGTKSISQQEYSIQNKQISIKPKLK